MVFSFNVNLNRCFGAYHAAVQTCCWTVLIKHGNTEPEIKLSLELQLLRLFKLVLG